MAFFRTAKSFCRSEGNSEENGSLPQKDLAVVKKAIVVSKPEHKNSGAILSSLPAVSSFSSTFVFKGALRVPFCSSPA